MFSICFPPFESGMIRICIALELLVAPAGRVVKTLLLTHVMPSHYFPLLNKGKMSRAAAASQFNATVGGCRPESSARFNVLRCFLSQKHAHTRLSQKYIDTKNMNECDQTTVPALEAIRGHRSAHSFATGPVIAEPFISPLGFTMTPALSSK